MKKNNRISKYYDLTKNIGEYKSSKQLIGWWTFNNKDSPLAQQIPSKAGPALPGKFIDLSNNQIILRHSSFESPTFLKGLQHLNKSSATVANDVKAFQVDAFTGGQISTSAFTLSITFRMLQAYPQPIGAGTGDGKIHIATIGDTIKPLGRLGLFFDSDGASGGDPSISTVINKDGAGTKIWQTPINYGNSRFKHVDHLRNWIRIDLVVNNIGKSATNTWLRDKGAKLYINGLDSGAELGTNGGTITASDITKLLIGGLDTALQGYGGKSGIQIGEVAIFRTALSSNEISYLYDNTRSSENSGKLTNSPRSQLACGECEHDSYPTVNRSTDWKRTGRRTPVFSDSDGFTVPTSGSVINYPTLLLSGTEAASAIGTVLTNNNSLPTIDTIVNTPAGLIGRSNIVRSYKNCSPTLDSSDIYKPFNEALIPINIATQPSHMSNILPGFSNTLGDRVIIDIDVTPSRAKVLRVVTGSQKGETFGELSIKADIEHTGLAYFNFVNGNFESIGARYSETGGRKNWNLPGQISSSVVVDRFNAEQDVGSVDLWNFSNGPFLQDLKNVPRIFQPYSSIVSHRGTFNQVHATEFNSFIYCMGKSRGSPDPAALSTSLWHKLQPAGLATSMFTSPSAGLGYGGLGNNEYEWSPYSSDVAGRGWVSPGATSDPDNNQKSSRIWNDPNEDLGPWTQNLISAFQSTLMTMGRPIAYTMWSKNSMFHASSSQTLKLNDYIDTPMLLESFEVNASVTTHRLLKPHLKEVTDDSGNDYIAQWSNTNNHIDCLTFFLLKQSSPSKAKNKSTAALQSAENSSRRELISYSNNIFTSPYVGYDWFDRSMSAVDVPNFPALPMGGSRTSRVFNVTQDDVFDHVPGTDSVSYYKDPITGNPKVAYGPTGIFFSNLDPCDVNGHPESAADLNVTNQPQEVYVTASINMTKSIPVRTLGMYSQKTTPILPFIQSNYYKSLSGDMLSPFFNGNNAPMFKSPAANIKVQPRFSLPCMGTFWPGGSTTSDEQPVVSSTLKLFSASKGYLATRLYDDNFTNPASTVRFFRTGSSNNFPYDFAGDIIAKTYTPSSRIVVANKGTHTTVFNSVGGTDLTAQKRTIEPALGLSHNPTFAISSNPADNLLTYQPDNPAPGFLHFGHTGSFVEQTGYILQPKDELILGVQWSPADAAHRSFKAIREGSKNLTFRAAGGQVSTYLGSDPSFGRACVIDMPAPEVGQHSYRHAGYCETNDLLMNASASCTIEKKPMTLRLYGTLLQNYSQKHHSLPQQLTTHCIHEVIGNEPILDIYDLSSIHEFSSSALSKNISGSMKSYSIYSVPSTYAEPYIASSLIGRGVRGSIKSKNLHDIGKLRRVITLLDMSEYYYDSLAPNIDEMFLADSAGPVTTSGSLQVGYGTSISPTYKYTLSRTVYPIRINGTGACVIESGVPSADRDKLNCKFARSFPFEPRYSGIERSFRQSNQTGYYFDSTATKIPTMYSSSLGNYIYGQVGFTPSNSINRAAPPYGISYVNNRSGYPGIGGIFEAGLLLQLSQEKIVKSRKMQTPARTELDWIGQPKFRADFKTGNYFTTPVAAWAPYAGIGISGSLHIANNFEVSEQTSLNGFFGVGNNRAGVLDHYYYYLTTVQVPGEAMVPAHASLLTQKPRGYRYGLISADPKRLSVVSRRDSFGQFRDVLEQRQYSALFINDPIDVAMNRSSNNLRQRNGERSVSAITCRFRTPIFENPTKTGQAAQVSPSETNSSNLSNAATSSIPFFDGELRNRDAAPSPDIESIVL